MTDMPLDCLIQRNLPAGTPVKFGIGRCTDGCHAEVLRFAGRDPRTSRAGLPASLMHVPNDVVGGNAYRGAVHRMVSSFLAAWSYPTLFAHVLREFIQRGARDDT